MLKPSSIFKSTILAIAGLSFFSSLSGYAATCPVPVNKIADTSHPSLTPPGWPDYKTPPTYYPQTVLKENVTVLNWNVHQQPGLPVVAPQASKSAAESESVRLWNQKYPGYTITSTWVDSTPYYSYLSLVCTAAKPCGGGLAVSTNVSCPTGYSLTGSVKVLPFYCSKVVPCTAGYVLNTAYKPSFYAVSGTCPAGYTLSGTNCVKTTAISACVLSISSNAKKPVNQQCTQYLVNGVYVNDPQDPDCTAACSDAPPAKAKGDPETCAGS